MTDRYRVLALDQRGHGESGWASADAYSNTEMVDDAAAFVTAMGLKRPPLLGLSMGGMVAINYAGQRPRGWRSWSSSTSAPRSSPPARPDPVGRARQ